MMKTIQHTTMPGKYIFLICLSFLTIFFACDDIFETDLSDKKVILTAPANKIRSKLSTQTFYWEELKGANSYKLQVVTPSFDTIQQFVADTNVVRNNFTLNLTPGRYQWRVIARNGSSKTDSFEVWSLQIDSTMDLTKQKVILDNPANDVATNTIKINFSWSQLYNATGYNVQIWKPDLNGSKVKDTTVTSIKVSMGSDLIDGSYTWGVKAFNNNTNTDLVTRTILIDRTAPTIKPSLTSPQKNEKLTSGSVTLSWNRADSDGGSKLFDSVYIAIDTFFTSNVMGYKSNTKNQSITLSQDTTYFWKVKTVDEAGNSGQEVIQKFFKTK